MTMEELKDCYWEKKETKLLVATRLEMHSKFEGGTRSKKSLWREVLNKIKTNNPLFTFSCDEIMKKFQNLYTTYTRIKKRNSESGNARTNWEYYEDFDSVYGNKHAREPPSNIIGDSLELSSILEKENSESEESSSNATPNKKSKRSTPTNSNIIEYMKQQDDNEERRHREYIDLEKEKLRVEKDKVDVLRELKSLMQ